LRRLPRLPASPEFSLLGSLSLCPSLLSLLCSLSISSRVRPLHSLRFCSLLSLMVLVPARVHLQVARSCARPPSSPCPSACSPSCLLGNWVCIVTRVATAGRAVRPLGSWRCQGNCTSFMAGHY
jgi:hypothetical protein